MNRLSKESCEITRSVDDCACHEEREREIDLISNLLHTCLWELIKSFILSYSFNFFCISLSLFHSLLSLLSPSYSNILIHLASRQSASYTYFPPLSPVCSSIIACLTPFTSQVILLRTVPYFLISFSLLRVIKGHVITLLRDVSLWHYIHLQWCVNFQHKKLSKQFDSST